MTNVAQSLFSLSTTPFTAPNYSGASTSYGYFTPDWANATSQKPTSTKAPNNSITKNLLFVISLPVGTTFLMAVCIVVVLKWKKHMRKREIEKALAPVYTYDNSEVEVNDSFCYHEEENNRNVFQEANGNQLLMDSDVNEVRFLDSGSVRRTTQKNEFQIYPV